MYLYASFDKQGAYQSFRPIHLVFASTGEDKVNWLKTLVSSWFIKIVLMKNKGIGWKLWKIA